MDDRTRKLLQEADWGPIGNELTAFAIHCIRDYQWSYGGAFEIPQGYTAKDIAQEVMLKTLSGERRWDPDKGELIPWLRWQVRSIVNARVKSEPHRYEILPPEDPSGSPDFDRLDSLSANSRATMAATPEELLIASEEDMQRADRLFEATKGDPEAEQLLMWMWEAVTEGRDHKPADIAAALDMPVTAVYNCIRRMKRRAQKGTGGV